MAKKFISVLGAGNHEGKYKECIYTWDNKSFKTEYIQEAIAHIFCSDWGKEDKIIIFTTEKSAGLHWNAENTLKDRLDKKFNATNRMIPFGSNSDEQWELFDTIFNSLEEGDEVIVDITQSFRTIPMFLIIILNYAKVLKNIKVSGIYYGAYDAKTKNADGVDVAPIFDLKMYDLIMDITNGINTFLKTGNSSVLAETCSEINNEAYRNNDSSLKNMNITVTSLNNFAKAIMTCRGNLMIKDKDKSIYWAYKTMEENLNQYEDSEDNLSKALNPLFEKVKEETKSFDDIDVVKNGISTVEWCINKGFIQQGITALEETIKTFTCVYINKMLNKNLDLYDEKHREDICNTVLNSQRFEITEKEKYYEVINEILSSGIIPEGLLKLEIQISDLRNDTNHFAMRKEKINSLNKMESKLKSYFKDFLEIIEDLS
ncbi:TIGR02221 family CRISPR-associated protein [Clostridium perfringens]|nr:TIGR02221 family CRISPR-associated protein [Clostridium perfringens]